MSQTSSKDGHRSSFHTDQELILVEEDECATLAEPMTLEGAKHLAQSGRVVTPCQTSPLSLAVTPPLSSSLSGGSPQAHLSSPVPSPLHHHSPLPGHHSHHARSSILLPLPSPPTHVSPALLSSSPHPLVSPPTHHLPLHHAMWGSPAVAHEGEDEETSSADLPSTVDIQAIRDSPSPDPSSGKLMTINENWDSLEDNHIPVIQEKSGDDESEVEEEEEELSNSSDADSQSGSSHSDSPSSPYNSQKRACSNERLVKEEEDKMDHLSRPVSRSRSDSGTDTGDSKSESDSQDSDSDSSICSSSEDVNSSSESSIEDDGENAEPVTPPRRKPQLRASKCFPIDTPRRNSVLAEGKLTDIHNRNDTPKSKENVAAISTKSINNEPSPDKHVKRFDMDSIMKCSSELFKSPIKNNLTSKGVKVDHDSKTKENGSNSSDSKVGLVSQNLSSPYVNKKKQIIRECINGGTHLEASSGSDSGCAKGSIIDDLAINDTLSRLKVEDSPEISKNEFEIQEGKNRKSSPVKAANRKILEERRLVKKKELELEFERLLKSSKPLTNRGNKLLMSSSERSSHHKRVVLDFIKESNASRLKLIQDKLPNCSLENGSDSKRNLCSNSVSSNNLILSKEFGDLERTTDRYFYDSSDCDDLSKCLRTNNKSESHSDSSKSNANGNFKASSNFDMSSDMEAYQSSSSKTSSKEKHLTSANSNSDVSDTKSKYYSSDSKSTFPSSSSESEDTLLPPASNKRTPSLNVTAKVIEGNKAKAIVKSPQSTSSSRSSTPSKTSSRCRDLFGRSPSKTPSKLDLSPKFIISPEDSLKGFRPTIADIVKVRERRKSLEKDSFPSESEIEREREVERAKRRLLKAKAKMEISRGSSTLEEELTSSSDTSTEELNEKIDLDSEQTQTFSVSESNFNQGRLTMKIAAMKMAKFGKTGLRAVNAGCLPTRSDIYPFPPGGLTNFKRPRMLPQVLKVGAKGSEALKVKTAAERKTYVDALPLKSYCSQAALRGRRGKGSTAKGDMRVPASSLYRGGGVLSHVPSIGFNAPHGHGHAHVGAAPNMEMEEEQISRLAQHLSQISNDHLTNGLQVLDQEDLAAILPDVSGVGPQPDSNNLGPHLDPFPDDVGFSRSRHSDSEELSGTDTGQENDNLLSMVMLPDDVNMHSSPGNNTIDGSMNLNVFEENINQKSFNHTTQPSHAKNCNPKELTAKEDGLDRRKKRPSRELKEVHDEEAEVVMPMLETYIPLDCNVSNVSPDSGIQSVSGSPLHPVGSPHHSPFYSSSLVTSHGSISNINSSGDISSANRDEVSASSSLRPFSPSISSQDSPPPPTLLPAVTPPHLVGSPRYSYDESAHSPPMPALKCQVDPPPWEVNHHLEDRGTGRPSEKGKLSSKDIPKRSRGRPKGSKNKRKENNEVFDRDKLNESFIKEPSNAEARLGKSEESESLTKNIDFSSMEHIWRGADLAEYDDGPSKNLNRKGPGRPKKNSQMDDKCDENEDAKDNREESSKEQEETKRKKNKERKESLKKDKSSKEKRPVGRPRKQAKEFDHHEDPIPILSSNKKYSSDRVMHKILNEKVRNSEKSDKLSIHSLPIEIPGSERCVLEELNSSAQSVTLTESDNTGKVSMREMDVCDKTSNLNNEKVQAVNVKEIVSENNIQKQNVVCALETNHDKKKAKSNSESSRKDDKKRGRGRKKQLPALPAIFEKVYASKEPSSKATTSKISTPSTGTASISTSHKKKKKKHKTKFKSKHKNIVDPVFLAELEEIIEDFRMCSIGKNLVLPLLKPGEILLPSIFKVRRVVFSGKKRRIEKPKSDRESGTEGEREKEKLHRNRKKKQQEVLKQGRERSEANEQRLPLKKRHRHISTAVPTSPDPPKVDSRIDAICSKISADLREKQSNKLMLDALKIIKADSKINRSLFENSSKGSTPETNFDTKSLNVDVQLNECNKVNNSENFYSSINRQSTGLKSFSDASVENFDFPKNDSSSLLSNPEKNSGDLKKVQIIHTISTVTPKKRHRLEAGQANSEIPEGEYTNSTLKTMDSTVKSALLVTHEEVDVQPKIDLEKNSKLNEKDEISKASVTKLIIGMQTLQKRERSRSPTKKQDSHIIEEFKSVKESKAVNETEFDPIKSKGLDISINGLREGETPEVLISSSNQTNKEEKEVIPSTNLKNIEEAYYDSDLPSEHEPLHESDQSGFMSDKEEPRELPKKSTKKRLKKKRELRSPPPKLEPRKIIPEELEGEKEKLPKKKIKRRKTNKTGFPTVRKKKRKVVIEKETCVEEEPKIDENKALKVDNILKLPCQDIQQEDEHRELITDNIPESKDTMECVVEDNLEKANDSSKLPIKEPEVDVKQQSKANNEPESSKDISNFKEVDIKLISLDAKLDSPVKKKRRKLSRAVKNPINEDDGEVLKSTNKVKSIDNVECQPCNVHLRKSKKISSLRSKREMSSVIDKGLPKDDSEDVPKQMDLVNVDKMNCGIPHDILPLDKISSKVVCKRLDTKEIESSMVKNEVDLKPKLRGRPKKRKGVSPLHQNDEVSNDFDVKEVSPIRRKTTELDRDNKENKVSPTRKRASEISKDSRENEVSLTRRKAAELKDLKCKETSPTRRNHANNSNDVRLNENSPFRNDPSIETSPSRRKCIDNASELRKNEASPVRKKPIKETSPTRRKGIDNGVCLYEKDISPTCKVTVEPIKPQKTKTTSPVRKKPVEICKDLRETLRERKKDKPIEVKVTSPTRNRFSEKKSKHTPDTLEAIFGKVADDGQDEKLESLDDPSSFSVLNNLENSETSQLILKSQISEGDLVTSPTPAVDPQVLERILEKVAGGTGVITRKKRELSEESIRTTMERKKMRRCGEDEIYDSDFTLQLSECQFSSDPPSSDECGRPRRGRKKMPRWRKKYLNAGLFSSYFKQEDTSRRTGDVGTSSRNRSTFDRSEHIHGLLPPPCYCRKWLRERQIDFCLPYDLWWMHKHNMLPGRDLVPSWNFKKVKSNVYYDIKLSNNFDIQACNCKRHLKPGEKGCGEDCINRMMFIECSSNTCPVSSCSNRRIQRHEGQNHTQRFMTACKGWGIKATKKLDIGTFIMEYVGEVLSEKEFKRRMQTKYVNDTHHYCLNLDRGMVIDGHRMGSDCRFVNHSCSPNCEMQKWCVNGQYRMALFALKDIEASEELTYDYNFSLFNPDVGQVCKCGSEDCRGVIGGKSQRMNGLSLEDKKKGLGRMKKEACKKRGRGASTDTEGSGCMGRLQVAPLKPLSHQQKLFILMHRCFLLRNLERVRKSRERLMRETEKKEEVIEEDLDEPTNKIEKFLTHFTALNTARSVKTRRLARAEDDIEMTRVAKLAQIFKDIYDKLVASRDSNDKPLATPFMSLPSKKKYPNYYTRVGEPIDLSIIEKNILTGHYTTAEVFDADIMRLFANTLRFFGRNTESGQMAVGLRKVYSECKLQFKPLLEEVIGEEQLPIAFANCTQNEEFEDEDVIRCVCNLHRDEGMMIQCERCLVWQHCDCMGVNEEAESPDHYLCEECSPRMVSPEVIMNPQPTDAPKGHKYFITLLRDNLQIKQGDSVVILHDRPTQKSGERRQPAYKLAKDVKIHDLLIFKVENLWIDEKGDKFAFGHHYLRPHETFHEPWRKFFPNEVFRSPLCEILPLDMIVNVCWVLDLNTYCRGKPIGCVDERLYICEYRVDKSAYVFSKISKPKYPICTKPFAFITYIEKLRPMRTYTPHEVISKRKGAYKSGVVVPQTETNVISENTATSNNATQQPEMGNVTIKGESDTLSCETLKSEENVNKKHDPCKIEKNDSSNTVDNIGEGEPPSVSLGRGALRNNRSSSRSQDRKMSVPDRNCRISTAESCGSSIVEYHAPAKKKDAQGNMQRTKRRLRVNSVATKLLKKLPQKYGVADLSYLLETKKRQRKKTAAFSS